jgi:hypothetical protein
VVGDIVDPVRNAGLSGHESVAGFGGVVVFSHAALVRRRDKVDLGGRKEVKSTGDCVYIFVYPVGGHKPT